jgi:hypothetical protein
MRVFRREHIDKSIYKMIREYIREHIYKRAPKEAIMAHVKRIKEKTFYLQRTNSIYREKILSMENTFYV